ncbi:DNA replication/repair protein RecF [Thaumasiovibrio subtropicus]|uniref:DNA replication/repair protein RecF n=1 Tax=Thaumasiovibrio subtropicus TaxID=1891207 RepID=UPI000B352BAB|nr:DNA replication/repair protein RecF [Thaumasiovibrio subtropicus]
MSLERLIIKDFRNLADCDLTLSDGFNYLIGDNGSGKTSVLEAIHFLGHGRSFRSHLTKRVIRHEQEALFVHGKIHQADQSPLPVGITKRRDGVTEVKIAGQTNQKLAQLAQIVPMQLITPEGFELLTGGPKFRRSFIDWGVFYLHPEFYNAWSRLTRLTKQRNAQLKRATQYREVAYWDAELALLCEQIDAWRRDYVEAVTARAAEICHAFLPDFEIRLSYYRGWDKESEYRQLLADNFERDCQLGYTVSGAHKADLRIKIGAIPVEDVLSRGQLKLMVCALRLAQGLHLTEKTGKQCLYLIDDFASELDSQKRGLLAQSLAQTGAQVFISAINEAQIGEMSSENGKMFYVENGKITAG